MVISVLKGNFNLSGRVVLKIIIIYILSVNSLLLLRHNIFNVNVKCYLTWVLVHGPYFGQEPEDYFWRRRKQRSGWSHEGSRWRQ